MVLGLGRMLAGWEFPWFGLEAAIGWARGIRNGREVGYAIEAKCDHPDCDADIDRGVSYMCGGPAFSDEGCEGYFCEKHLYAIDPIGDEHTTHLCRPCFVAYIETYATTAMTCPKCGQRGVLADFGIEATVEHLSDYGACPKCEEECQLKDLVEPPVS